MFEITLLAHLCFFKNKTDFAVLDQSKVPFTTMLSMSSFSGYICITLLRVTAVNLIKYRGTRLKCCLEKTITRSKDCGAKWHNFL